jgi:NSS family neurotransmitter:Na+ symporter
MVSLLEVPAAYAVHRLGMRRGIAAATISAAILAIGIPSALSYGALSGIEIAGRPVLDAIDHAVSNFLLPTGGLLIALLVGWRLSPKRAMAEADLAGGWIGPAWIWLLRIVVPAMIAIIMLRSAAVV